MCVRYANEGRREKCCSFIVGLFAAEVVVIEDVLLKPTICVRWGWKVVFEDFIRFKN